MKKFLFLLLIIINLLFGGLFVKEVRAEYIRSFESEIKINKDATIDVKEKIIYDFGGLRKHGIYRKIPKIKINQDGKKYILDYSDIKVIDENNLPYKFSKSIVNDNLELKIGDPNKTVYGLKTYIIYYKVSGAITYFSDHDELYWNINGNDWEVAITNTNSKIIFPQKIDENNLKIDCFTGLYGSKNKNCQYHFDNGRDQDGTSVIFSSDNILNPKEGLSIVVSFPINIVVHLEPKEYIAFSKTWLGKILTGLIKLIVFIWYFILPFYIIYRWFNYGRDPKGIMGITTAYYDPPKTHDGKRFLAPAEVGILGDETVDLKDISATIVDLARRGYLRIEERKKGDYYLVRLDKPISTASVGIGLLEYEKTLLNKFFKSKKEIRLKDEKLYDEVEEIKKELYEDVVKIGLFPKNPENVRKGYYILSVIALFTGNFFLAIVAFIFGRAMPRKTIEGVNAFNIAKSLKNFLTSQKRQLEFQSDHQIMFEKLLPYAMVFEVERIWAKRFENINLKQPDWYQGYSVGYFNSVILANSLSSSISSFRASATPTRSTTGFSSGFGGGGFSGGGGGGGGGGSW